MYGKSNMRKWRMLTVIVLSVMSFVFVFHSVIPHEHPHDLLPLGPFGILHDGLAEKFFIFISVMFAFLFLLPNSPSLDPGKRLTTKLGTQSLAARARILYRLLFTKGIVHLNQR